MGRSQVMGTGKRTWKGKSGDGWGKEDRGGARGQGLGVSQRRLWWKREGTEQKGPGKRVLKRCRMKKLEMGIVKWRKKDGQQTRGCQEKAGERGKEGHTGREEKGLGREKAHWRQINGGEWTIMTQGTEEDLGRRGAWN